ncbi:MAG: hypothetical protein ABIK48_04740 [candidate division WOR-3 bacterium]
MRCWTVLVFAGLVMSGSAQWVSVGPDGGNVQALAVDPQNPDRLLAISYTYPDTPQVYFSSDRGASWQVQGRFDQISASALELDPFVQDRVYALGGSGYVLISTDCGASWRMGILPGLNNTLKPDPHHAGRVLVGGYDVINGNYLPVVQISTDYGASWTRVIIDSTANNRPVQHLAFDPSVPDVVWAGCIAGRIYRSSDGGFTWEPRHTGVAPLAGVYRLAVSPANSELLLAGTSAGIYRTTDGGLHWTPLGLSRTRIVVFPLTDTSRAYAVSYDTVLFTERVFVSSDTGVTWSAAEPGMVLAKSGGLIADPQVRDLAYIYCNRGVFRSTDAGTHWSERHTGMRFAHISTISVSPTDSSRVYLEFYENGVYRSDDGGITWERCPEFLDCGNICGIGVAPGAGADILYALEGKG